jgi:hypothetical protein
MMMAEATPSSSLKRQEWILQVPASAMLRCAMTCALLSK